MSLLHLNRAAVNYKLENKDQPELYRDIYPYTKICRINFDDTFIMPRPADPMFITDTTFRDGQQARPPYTVSQTVHIFDLLHRLAGYSGLIHTSEFFLYSEKDRKALEACLNRGYEYPKITGWIRANKDDLKLVRDLGLKETGILTSVSDYHIYLKLGKDRQTMLEHYLDVIRQALEWGITPRCHFEDITRADIYGFCLPFAQELMEMSRQSGIQIKIRLCDTMGYGVPYPGVALPRSVPRIVRIFTDKAMVPGSALEWHGHNDFHKVLINASTAWVYGCSGANGTLLGFGERTGNAPIEALVVEYISMTGEDNRAETRVISEIAEYFSKELGYHIPHNYPLVGRDFNATSAGIHVDGLAKNEEIYNIFDTEQLLGRKVPIIITDKSGKAGIAYWINSHLDLQGDDQVDKRHPAVGRIYTKIMQEYEKGRTTSLSNQEMERLAKRYLPELFVSEFDHLKKLAQTMSSRIMEDLVVDPRISSMDRKKAEEAMAEFLDEYNFIQFIYLTDMTAKLTASGVTDMADRPKFSPMKNADFSDRDWFNAPLTNGKLHITDFYRSHYTGRLCLTVSLPVLGADENIVGVLGADIRFEELVRRESDLDI